MAFEAYAKRFFLYICSLFGFFEPKFDQTTKVLESSNSILLPRFRSDKSLGQQIYDVLQRKGKQVMQVIGTVLLLLKL
jgi:hypothetical protein